MPPPRPARTVRRIHAHGILAHEIGAIMVTSAESDEYGETPPDPTPAPPPPPPEPTTRVRRDIWHLQPTTATPWHPIVLAYAEAVGTMKATPLSERQLSWQWQTQVHGMSIPQPPDDFRKQCQHFNWFFLPWHRMYLFHFEAILRSIIEGLDSVSQETKDEWALPYWDYDRADARFLPPPFRARFIEDDPARPNPLFEPQRLGSMNAGTSGITPAQSGAAAWFPATPFAEATPLSGFGGSIVRQWSHGGPQGGPLENGPHGSVHVAVAGGAVPAMGRFETAGRDPIFWLHHANIDRLWEVWRTTTGQGLDESDTGFLDFGFHFLDADGVDETMTPRDVVDTPPLGYTYEDIGVPASAGLPRGGQRMPRGTERTEGPDRIGAVDHSITLAEGLPNVVEIPVSDLPRSTDAATLPPLHLSVEHLTAEPEPGATYGVFVDPDGDGPAESVLVGTLPLFGLAESNEPDADHGVSYTFDITQAVATLMEHGQFDPTRARVSFRSVSDPAAGLPLPAVEIGSLSIYRG